MSITVANLFAIRQKDLKRFLAFSSISQAGYIMLAVIGGRDVYKRQLQEVVPRAERRGQDSARRCLYMFMARFPAQCQKRAVQGHGRHLPDSRV